jgi:hypothetical protein
VEVGGEIMGNEQAGREDCSDGSNGGAKQAGDGGINTWRERETEAGKARRREERERDRERDQERRRDFCQRLSLSLSSSQALGDITNQRTR